MLRNERWTRRIRRGLLWFGALHVVGLVLGLGVLVFAQWLVMYHPLPGGTETPADVGLTHEPVTLRTDDGEELRAWFVRADQPRGAVLYCFGGRGLGSGG